MEILIKLGIYIIGLLQLVIFLVLQLVVLNFNLIYLLLN